MFLWSERSVILQRMDNFVPGLFLTHLLIFLIEMNEEFDCVLRISPSLFNISLRELSEDFHKGNETIGDFDEPREDNKEAEKEK